jgi:hypothetical protein
MSVIRILQAVWLRSGVFRVPGLLVEYVAVPHFRVEEVGKK